MYSVKNQPTRRTVVVRLSGIIEDAEMRAFAAEAHAATDAYRNAPHLVLADARGLKTCAASTATILKEVILHGRAHGVVVCVHVTDESVTKLQLGRLARQGAPTDSVTIEVATIEEAESVLGEKRYELMAKEPLREPPRDHGKEHAREPVKEHAREPAKEHVKEHAKDPA
jgi:hypothetical protein